MAAPGPLWDVAFAGTALAAFVGAACLAYAVHADATARGSDHASAWGVVVAAFAPLAVGYLLLRSRLGPRGPPSDRERLARAVAAAVVAAFVVGAVLAPPDPYAQVLWFWPSLAVAVPVAYYLFGRR